MTKRRSIFQSHKSEVQAIRNLVRVLGGSVNVTHQSGRVCGTAGIPDLYIQVAGKKLRFWMEVKVGRDKLRQGQKDFIERERRSGGIVVVGTADDLIRFLKGQGFAIL